MSGTRGRLRAALARQDLDAFLAELDPDVVWLGVVDADGGTPVCRNRAEVRQVFETALAEGRRGNPEVLAETDDRLIIDMHPEPPHEQLPELTQVLMIRADKVVRMDDHPDRRSAFEATGLA